MRVFNRGLALDSGFCNRKKEIAQLTSNIKNHTHTVLISPRRYGKTSLVLRVVEREKLPCCHIDLFMKYDRSLIIQEFYDQIAKLMSTLIKPTQKAIKKIESFLQFIKISLTWNNASVEFSLAPQTKNKQSLKILLEGIDEFLKKEKKQIIIFIDEMQTIVDSDIRDEFESDLRFIAQKTKNIIFIFSGSHRHLLSQVFDDRSRPFYKLCHPMMLKKIEASHYHQHLAIYSKKKWKKELGESVQQQITDLTLCHPYYYNILCEKLFDHDFPDESMVLKTWKEVCAEEQSSIGKDLEFLSSKQQQLLSILARNPGTKEPSGKAFLSQVNLTGKGVLDALNVLSRHDLIERDEQGAIWVIDPVLAYWAER